MIMNKVDGAKLRELRYGRELTQVELSSQSGVNRRTISNIENGYNSVTLKTLNKLAAILNIEASQLISG